MFTDQTKRSGGSDLVVPIMTGLKRTRDQMSSDASLVQSQSVAHALLGLSQADASHSPKKTKLTTTGADVVNQLMKPTPLIADVPLEQRQVVFKLALQTAGKVVDSIWKCALEAGNSEKEEGLSQIVVNQLCSIQSFYCLVVAELGKMCMIVSTDKNELQMKMMQVIVEEIKRLGAAKTAVDLLKLLSTQVDQVLSNSAVSPLIGSVTDSLSQTFSILRRCIQKNSETGKYQVRATKLPRTAATATSTATALKELSSPVVVPRPLTPGFLEAAKENHGLNHLRVEATACY